MTNMTRAALLNVLSAPYVEMAVLKGLPRSWVIWRHALPNVLAPIINVVAVNLAYLALQLHFLMSSESMGNHDSGPDDWWRVG
jgi:ABC-type dipeptide/oligopeptide/nickel transport system permease component